MYLPGMKSRSCQSFPGKDGKGRFSGILLIASIFSLPGFVNTTGRFAAALERSERNLVPIEALSYVRLPVYERLAGLHQPVSGYRCSRTSFLLYVSFQITWPVNRTRISFPVTGVNIQPV